MSKNVEDQWVNLGILLSTKDQDNDFLLLGHPSGFALETWKEIRIITREPHDAFSCGAGKRCEGRSINCRLLPSFVLSYSGMVDC